MKPIVVASLCSVNALHSDGIFIFLCVLSDLLCFNLPSSFDVVANDHQPTLRIQVPAFYVIMISFAMCLTLVTCTNSLIHTTVPRIATFKN